jgi:hypothetical protein
MAAISLKYQRAGSNCELMRGPKSGAPRVTVRTVSTPMTFVNILNLDGRTAIFIRNVASGAIWQNIYLIIGLWSSRLHLLGTKELLLSAGESGPFGFPHEVLCHCCEVYKMAPLTRRLTQRPVADNVAHRHIRQLPAEIWWLVLQEYQGKLDFQSLYDCARVSKSMASLALPLLYRSVPSSRLG